MAEALRPERETYGPKALNNQQESLGKRIDPNKDVIDVDFDAETAALLAALGIDSDAADSSEANDALDDADKALEDIEEKAEKYHTAASKVYEIANKFERDISPLNDSDRESLNLIKSWMPSFIRDEQKVVDSAGSNISKLRSVVTTITDPDKLTQITDRIVALESQKNEAEKRSKQHEIFTRYIGMLFVENNNRIAGKAGGKPDLNKAKVEAAPTPATQEEFEEAAFTQELEAKISDFVRRSEDLGSLFSNPDRTVLVKDYPQERRGESQLINLEGQFSRVQKDLQATNLLFDQLTSYRNQKFPTGATLSILDANKRDYINNKVLPWLTRLKKELGELEKQLGLKKDKKAVDQWERDTAVGLGRSEFRSVKTAIENINQNKQYTSVKEYSAQRTTLVNNRNALLDNGGVLVTETIDNLRKTGVQAVVVTENRDRIQRDYIDAGAAAIETLDRNLLSFWETKHLEQNVFNTLRPLEIVTPKTLSEFQSNHAQRSKEIARLEGQRAVFIGELPTTIQAEAGTYFDTQIREARGRLQSVENAQTNYWQNEVLAASHDPMRFVETARSEGKTVASAETDNTKIDTAIQRLDDADRQLDTALAANLNLFINDNQRNEATRQVQEHKAENERVKDLLRRRKEKNVEDLAARGVEQTKTGLSDAVSNIITLEVQKNPDTGAEVNTLAELLPLQEALDTAVKSLIAIGVRIQDADPAYGEARTKIDAMVERARIREMSFEQVVNIAKAKNIDVFVEAKLVDNIQDPYTREVVRRLQSFYFKDIDSLPPAERERHRRLKVDIWTERQLDEHYDKRFFPAAKQYDDHGNEVLFTKFVKRGMTREDLLAVTNREHYEAVSREMLEEGIALIAGEVLPDRRVEADIRRERGQGPKWKVKLDYGSCADFSEAPALMQDYLKKKYLDSGKMPKDQFDNLWKMFIAFDLVSIGLARNQKDTQTASHNTDKGSSDRRFLSYPMHVLSHSRNRYGNLDVSAQHLLVFTGHYPTEQSMRIVRDPYTGKPIEDTATGDYERALMYEWSGNETHANGVRVRTEEETRELILARMRYAMPLDGIENQVLTSGTDDEWNKPILPDNLDFLTVPLSSEGGKLDKKIGNTDNYLKAQDGWKRMLDMTTQGFPNDLTLGQIFDEGGYYKKFVNEGMGLAKLVKGDHYKWFVPMLRYFIGRMATGFHGTNASDRRELQEKFVQQLSTGLNSGLNIPEIRKDVEDLLHDLEHGHNKNGPAWEGIPEILIPVKERRDAREKRIAYAEVWWRDVKRGTKLENNPPPVGDIKIRESWAKATRSDKDPHVGMFYAIVEQGVLHFPINRNAFDTDTSAKAKTA